MTLALVGGPASSFAQDAAAPPPAPAATEKPPTAQTHPNNPEIWNVDQMMEDAVLQISRRYNLNEAQENYTRLLLVKRVRTFLEVYEADVRELLKESIDLRLGLKPQTVEAYKNWATRAAPIYDAAKKAILDGNEEWRGILNPEQIKIHDADVALMKANFEQVTRVMEDWKAGRGPGAATVVATEQPAEGPKQAGQVTQNPVTAVRRDIEDSWSDYVSFFIRTFKLDEKMAIAARDKILKELRDEANSYRAKRRREFEAVEAELKGATSAARAAEARKRKVELEKHIQELFITLDRRLDSLLESKQRTSADPQQLRQLESWYEMLAGRPRESARRGRATPAPASQPDARPQQGRPSEATPKPAAEKTGESAPGKPAEKPSNSNADEPASAQPLKP